MIDFLRVGGQMVSTHVEAWGVASLAHLFIDRNCECVSWFGQRNSPFRRHKL